MRYILCIETFVQQTSIFFELAIWTHVLLLYCIATGYFCCLLINNIVYILFFSGDLPAMNICLQAKCQVWWFYDFVREEKNMKKQVLLYFPDDMSKYIYFELIYFCLYVLDIDVTRNGNILKLKVKSEFSLIKHGLNANRT